MELIIRLKLDNAAFDDGDGNLCVEEIRRILEVAADKIDNGRTKAKLVDMNGNGVGVMCLMRQGR